MATGTKITKAAANKAPEAHTRLGAAPMRPVTTPMPNKLMRWRAIKVCRSSALANSASTSKAITR